MKSSLSVSLLRNYLICSHLKLLTLKGVFTPHSMVQPRAEGKTQVPPKHSQSLCTAHKVLCKHLFILVHMLPSLPHQVRKYYCHHFTDGRSECRWVWWLTRNHWGWFRAEALSSQPPNLTQQVTFPPRPDNIGSASSIYLPPTCPVKQ